MLLTIWHSPAAKGALAGFLASSYTDFLAFRSWKSFDDAKQYQWGLAIWRWIQGTVIGALSAAGYGLVG